MCLYRPWKRHPWFLCSVFIPESGVRLLSTLLSSRLFRSSPSSSESCLTRLPPSNLALICSFFPQAQNLFHLLLELKQNHWLVLGPSIALDWVHHWFLIHHSHASCTFHLGQGHASCHQVTLFVPHWIATLANLSHLTHPNQIGSFQAFGVWLDLLPSSSHPQIVSVP